MRRTLGWISAALLAAAVMVASAQNQTAAPPATAAGSAVGSTTGTVDVTITIDPSGGPAALETAVKTAIDAWGTAAPGLSTVTVAPSAASTLRYAVPALLGPDTLSLDTRVPGEAGVTIAVSSQAVAAHPMVLLHEVGVLLGLTEGTQGVMSYAVPAAAEPDAPTTADVAALRASLTFAPEDLDHDGRVDFYDLVLFGQAFGRQGVNLPADFNGDGRVDGTDLALLEKAYQFTAPARSGPGTDTTPTTSPPAPAGSGSTSSGSSTTSGSGASPGSTP